MARILIQGAAITQSNGTVRILAGATVTVKDGNGDNVTLYSGKSTSEEVANPYTADSNGNYSFWTDRVAGLTATITSGETSATYTVEQDAVPYDTVADLLASTETARGEGAIWEAGGYRYTEAAPGASDHHLTNSAATPVKLYVAPKDGILDFRAFGPNYDGSTSDAALLQTCLNYAKTAAGVQKVVIDGNLSLPKGAQTVSAYAVAKGDPSFDMPLTYAVLLDGADDLTIDLTGATITTDTGTPLVIYNCQNCEVIGGDFSITGSAAGIASDQSTAVLITRSLNCWGRGIKVDGYYRNLTAYRAPECGFEDCYSVDALYYCYYTASALDITITGAPDVTWQYLRDNFASGGRYGNYFTDQTVAESNYSEDCSPSGNDAAHFKTELGNCIWENNRAKESAAQNSGDVINLFSAVPSSIATDNISNMHIRNNRGVGGYVAFRLSGLTEFSLIGNTCKDYYQTGIALVTETVGADDLSLQNGVVAGNVVLNMNDASTRTSTGNYKNAGFQVETNNSLAIENVAIFANSIDALGDNGTKTPTYNVYIEDTAGTAVRGFQANTWASSPASTIPSWAFIHERHTPYTSLTSQGSTGTPYSLSATHFRDGQIRVYDTQAELPSAKAGMRCTVQATSTTCRLYVNGANSSTTGSDTIYIPGGSPTSTQKNIQFTGPAFVEMSCAVDGQWMAAESKGTTLTVTT